MFVIIFLKLVISILSFSSSGQRIEKKCFNRSEPIGRYLGKDYQIVYASEKHFLELECQACNETLTSRNNVSWSTITLSPTHGNPVYNPFKSKSRKSKKRMRILENNGLLVKKIKSKNNGLYSCNTTRRNEGDNSTIELSFNYLVYVIGKKNLSEVPTGSLTEWKKYRENFLNEIDDQLDDESVQDQIAKLDVIWSNWTDCLCGSYIYDTKRFRYAYPIVAVNESDYQAPIFPAQSDWLVEFYPRFGSIAQNVTIFREYERCVDDCVPDALETDVDYKYEDNIYMPEGSDIKLMCPESENATEVLWILNEEKILPRSFHAFGTGNNQAHVSVDQSDELFLLSVCPDENGVYSCIADDAPIRKITITVVPKSLFLTNDFLQCVLTIAYVLFFCFIACIFILCAKIYHIHTVYK